MKYSFFCLLVLCFLSACKKKTDEQVIQPETIITPSSPITVDPSEALLAGGASVNDNSSNAFGIQAPNVSSVSFGIFATGNSLFKASWVTAPSSTEGRDGLGAIMNATSCGACHTFDGRGKPHDETFTPNAGLLFRLSVLGTNAHGESNPDPNYGGQFQPKSILAAKNEGDVKITYTEIPGNYPDGTTYSLRSPIYTFENLNFGEMAANVMVSPRLAQQIPGLGLLEALSDSTILARSDPNDTDGDGISGRPNYVWDVESSSKKLGRFGWKANQPSIKQQVAGAFNGDIGITSSLFPSEGLTDYQKELFKDIPNGGSPELDDDKLDQVTAYCATLAVPYRRNISDPDVIEGKILFAQAGCDKCHLSKVKTGVYALVPEFSNKTIKPYTDMLLHDMGNGLADNRPDFEATGNEWRTPPLWGIGMVKVVNKHTFFLHDGRARNFEEAILWHGGEGEKSKTEFTKLNAKQRLQLITFLENL